MNTEKYRLKKCAYIGGVRYEIRCDYSVILDIIEALNDPELDEKERAYVAMYIFYPAFEEIPEKHYQEAIDFCLKFIGGDGPQISKNAPKLVDFEMDFPIVVGAINRVLGYDIREIPYDAKTNAGGVSWETFLSAYQEIGDCTFAQVVRIRDQLARGKTLDKSDREWYRRNRELVDFKNKYTSSQKDLLKEWGGA